MVKLTITETQKMDNMIADAVKGALGYKHPILAYRTLRDFWAACAMDAGAEGNCDAAEMFRVFRNRANIGYQELMDERPSYLGAQQ